MRSDKWSCDTHWKKDAYCCKYCYGQPWQWGGAAAEAASISAASTAAASRLFLVHRLFFG